jgi:hypothetical protein
MIAILDALGVAFYVFLVSLIMNYGSKIFGEKDSAITPIAVLLLFVLSALVTSGLVLGRPIMLYLDGQKKEGVKLLLYTGLSLFVLLMLVFAIMILIR